MKKSTQIATGTGIIGLGALVALTPRYIFPICEYYGVSMDVMGKAMPMSCYYTAKAALLAGLFIILVGLAVITAKPAALRALSMVLAGAGLAVVLIPSVIFPLCHNPDMHCNHGTMPLLIVLGISTIITSGWLTYGSRSQVLMMHEMASDASA